MPDEIPEIPGTPEPEYLILTAESESELGRRVTSWIRQGWSLLGGVSVCPKNAATFAHLFAQALTR